MGRRRHLALLGGRPLFPEGVYFTRPPPPREADFHALLQTIFQTRWFTNDGALLRRLEERLTERLGVESCLVFCNATIALQAALRSLDLSGEIITTPFTFPATVQAIDWIGLTPVFGDIDPDTYNLDPEAAGELITERTSGLLPVHVFGNPCEVEELEKLAGKRRLKIVYDAAHAFGVRARGRPIGAWGDLSVFSFHATKLFHTAEGGAVSGGDLARLALLRNFGIVNEETVRGRGVNGKMSELHAALGLALLDSVEEEIRLRGCLISAYLERLRGLPGIRFQKTAPGTVSNNAYFSIEVVPDAFGLSRNALHKALRAENICSRKYFFPLCSENPIYREHGSAHPRRLPKAHRLASRILCLPLFGDLGVDAVDRITECIRDVRENCRSVLAATESA